MRSKPEHKRRIFAVLTSTGVTAIILIVWFTTYASGFSKELSGTKNEVLGPFASFKANIAGAFVSFQNSLGGVKETVGSIATEVEKQYQAQLVNTYTATDNSVTNTAK